MLYHWHLTIWHSFKAFVFTRSDETFTNYFKTNFNTRLTFLFEKKQKQKHKPFKCKLNFRFFFVVVVVVVFIIIIIIIIFQSNFYGHSTCSAQRACVTLASVELVPRTLFNSVHQPIRDKRRGGVKFWQQLSYQ